jgi:hypothetical protein
MKKEEIPIESVTEELIKITKVTNAETEEEIYKYDISGVKEDDVPVLLLHLKQIEQDLMEFMEESNG